MQEDCRYVLTLLVFYLLKELKDLILFFLLFSCFFGETTVTPNNGSFPWTVSRMGMTNGDFYYVSAFGIANPTNSALDKHFNAHYINITDHPNSPSSTTVTPSSTSASSSGSMTAQASATSATLSPLPSSSSSSSNKLPLAVGLGVGLPLGLMAVVGLIWLVQRHRRKSIPVLVGQEEAGGSQVYPKSELDSETAFYYQTEGVTEYHEVEGTPPERVWPQELDARGE